MRSVSMNQVLGAIALSLVLAAAGCAGASRRAMPPPPTELPVDDGAIVPGKRVGNVAIGMTGTQLLQAKGHPSSPVDWGGYTGYSYFQPDGKLDMTVLVDDDTQQVIAVIAQADRYRVQGSNFGTADGVLEMRAALGKPASQEERGNEQLPMTLYCYASGVGVQIQGSGRINDIAVFLPGDTCR